jgi:hypothetical protein
MGLLAMLAGHLRMLLGVCGMFLALSVIAFAVLLGSGAMGFCRILVMFGSLIMFFSGH